MQTNFDLKALTLEGGVYATLYNFSNAETEIL